MNKKRLGITIAVLAVGVGVAMMVDFLTAPSPRTSPRTVATEKKGAEAPAPPPTVDQRLEALESAIRGTASLEFAQSLSQRLTALEKRVTAIATPAPVAKKETPQKKGGGKKGRRK